MKSKLLIGFALAGLALAGCDTNAGNDALIGGAAGAGLGAIVGHNSRMGTAGGALVGGSLGAVTGAVIGSDQDRREDAANQPPPPTPPPVYYQAPPPQAAPPPPPAVYYQADPPAPPAEVITVQPYPRAVWVRGYYVRDGYHRWAWVPGHWE